MSQNISLHENYHDEGPTEAGSDRKFGCIVGAILMALGVTKIFSAGSLTSVSLLMFVAGTVLLVLGIFAPARLSVLNRLWMRLGVIISKIVNPIIMALLFFCVVTPMAFVMRVAGRRPLRLPADPGAATYWIAREPEGSGPPKMRRQF